jgi:hypothetical protein
VPANVAHHFAHVSGVVLGQVAFPRAQDLQDAPAGLVAGRLAARSLSPTDFDSSVGRKSASCAAPLKVWFPDGIDTKGLSLIKVCVDSAEYWESPSSKVRQLIGAARAAATGDPDKFPATSRSVDLRNGFASHIVTAAAARGHEVTASSRHAPEMPVDGVTYVHAPGRA